MTAETETPIEPSEDLEAFEKDFFNKSSDDVKPEKTEEPEAPEPEKEKEADAPTPEPESEKEEEEKPQPEKKQTAQERIRELANARREAEKRAEELERQLEALKENPKKDAPVKEAPKGGEPSPDELGEDGEPKYPLGEFDPQYIRDLTKFTIEQEKAAMEAERVKVDKQREADAIKNQLLSDWEAKVESVKEELPDFQTKAVSLEDTFSDLDPAYGEFLASTIMSLEHGPQIIYHLAENLDEAAEIVKLGPVMAAVTLGKLEATLGGKKVIPAKASDAPPPPPRNRGGSAVVPIRGDTDDLDAFEKEFFKKK